MADEPKIGKGHAVGMLRFVVELESKEPRDPNPEMHYFDTYQEGAAFAWKNRYRAPKHYSEDKEIDPEIGYRRKRNEYYVMGDPNK
jgi:hypothetical protein